MSDDFLSQVRAIIGDVIPFLGDRIENETGHKCHVAVCIALDLGRTNLVTVSATCPIQETDRILRAGLILVEKTRDEVAQRTTPEAG